MPGIHISHGVLKPETSGKAADLILVGKLWDLSFGTEEDQGQALIQKIKPS